MGVWEKIERLAVTSYISKENEPSSIYDFVYKSFWLKYYRANNEYPSIKWRINGRDYTDMAQMDIGGILQSVTDSVYNTQWGKAEWRKDMNKWFVDWQKQIKLQVPSKNVTIEAFIKFDDRTVRRAMIINEVVFEAVD